MAKEILKILNRIVDLAVMLALTIALSYSAYALWDNSRIYAQAENVQADMLRMKPKSSSSEDTKASFEELREINPDVCAWLTLCGTNIDYPVLQGADDLSYINTDVYGSFALSGSIFLDSRCSSSFTDEYSLLYGHHMDRGRMFGDLDLYREEKFFLENSSGTLILPDRAYTLEIFACLLVPAREEAIFRPEKWQANASGYMDFICGNSLCVRTDTAYSLSGDARPVQILAMSTCASDFSEARTVVLARMIPCQPEIQVEDDL